MSRLDTPNVEVKIFLDNAERKIRKATFERNLWKAVEEYQSTNNRFERETLKWKYELENEKYKECLAKDSGIGDLKLLSNNIETFKCKYEENLQLQLQHESRNVDLNSSPNINVSPQAVIHNNNSEGNITPNFTPLKSINNGSPLPAFPNNNSVLGKRKIEEIHKDESTIRPENKKKKRMVLCDFTVPYGTIIRDSNKNRSIQKVDRGNNKQNWMKLKQDGTEPKRRTYVKSFKDWYGGPMQREYKRKNIKICQPGAEEISWDEFQSTQNVSNDSRNVSPINSRSGSQNQENCSDGSD